MKIRDIFKFARKGSKKVKKSRGSGGGAPGVKWPEGTRVGVFGHENSGKTVYFTALYTQSKTTGDFNLSVRDNATANEFFKNDMAIKGVDVDGGGTGTIAARPVPKKFPAPTDRDLILQFTAILDGKTKVPVVTYDYDGKAASISEHSEQSEKVREFMMEADGLLFFFDPKILAADPEVQARASTFINILESIVPLRSRLPVPVGLVVTKADTLPGYRGEDQAVLVPPEQEQIVAEDYEVFLEKILESPSVSSDREWAGTVRNVLVKLREFIRVVVGRTLDFQIFFVSSTGSRPEKIGVDVGRSIYAPPEKINPCGVTKPFHWILGSILRSQRLNVMRRLARTVAVLSMIWMVLYSIPFLWHFGGLLRAPLRQERSVLGSVDGIHFNISDDQKRTIVREYDKYSRRWLVKNWFPEYAQKATQMKEIYENLNIELAVARLDSIITGMTGVVADQGRHPKYDQGQDSLLMSDEHRRLEGSLERMHTGDKTAVLYMRSDRALYYWDLFKQWVVDPADTSALEKINYQVNFNLENAKNYGEAEKELGGALLSLLDIKAPRATPTVRSVRSNLDEYNQLRDKINNSDDPSYVLGEVPARLRAVREGLSPSGNAAQVAAINAFLAEVAEWEKTRTYTCVLRKVPDFGHLHIEVTETGGNPSWSKETQLLEGDEVKLRWKPGDDIHIGYDGLHYECSWGRQAEDRVVFQDKYALFRMEGEVTFPNAGKTVVLTFKGGLREKLPRLR